MAVGYLSEQEGYMCPSIQKQEKMRSLGAIDPRSVKNTSFLFFLVKVLDFDLFANLLVTVLIRQSSEQLNYNSTQQNPLYLFSSSKTSEYSRNISPAGFQLSGLISFEPAGDE